MAARCQKSREIVRCSISTKCSGVAARRTHPSQIADLAYADGNATIMDSGTGWARLVQDVLLVHTRRW